MIPSTKSIVIDGSLVTDWHPDCTPSPSRTSRRPLPLLTINCLCDRQQEIVLLPDPVIPVKITLINPELGPIFC